MQDYVWGFKTGSLSLSLIVGAPDEQIDDVFKITMFKNSEIGEEQLIMFIHSPIKINIQSRLTADKLKAAMVYRCNEDTGYTSVTVDTLNQKDYNIKTLHDAMTRFHPMTAVYFPRKPNINEIEYITQQLTDPLCPIQELTLCSIPNLGMKGLELIKNAIHKNISLTKLIASTVINGDDPQHLPFVDPFIKSISHAIRFHSRLKRLDISANFGISMSEIIQSIPKSLVHLDITFNNITAEHFTHIAINTRIQSLHATTYDYFEYGDHALLDRDTLPLLASLTLTSFNFIELDHVCDPKVCEPKDCTDNSADELVHDFRIMLKQNLKAKEDAKRAALCLIGIRKHRRGIRGFHRNIPKDLVLNIARLIVESYDKNEWREQLVETQQRIGILVYLT